VVRLRYGVLATLLLATGCTGLCLCPRPTATAPTRPVQVDVSGTVVGPQDRLRGGRLVFIAEGPGRPADATFEAIRLEADGTFRCRVPAGAYRVEVYPPDADTAGAVHHVLVSSVQREFQFDLPR